MEELSSKKFGKRGKKIPELSFGLLKPLAIAHPRMALR